MRKLGDWGEGLAATAYQNRGFTLVEKNWHCRYGEIDLIVADDTWLVFVEVKLRKNKAFGQAYEAVTPSKQEKLRITAELYLAQHPTQLQPRFDVVSIYAPQGADTAHPALECLENAF